ncbi:MAG TPA: acyl carrier protein [Stellaceae bacterium]
MPGRVAQVFGEILKIDPSRISDETAPDNTPQWDSLATMRLVVAVQDAFSVQLSITEIMAMRTVGLVRSILRRKGVMET